MPCIWRANRAQVAEPFATDVTALLDADPGTWVITCGKRDPAIEATGYARWLADPENAPKYTNPKNSAHCCDPRAFAVDVTLVVGTSDDWNYKDAAWQRMIAAVGKHPRLHSGASFNDSDHIEAVNWRHLAAGVTLA